MTLGEQIDAQILNRIGQGQPLVHVRAEMGITKHSLYQRLKRMRERGIDTCYQRVGVDNSSDSTRLKYRYSETVESDPRKASVWHLVDLKRAGHSPMQTELNITTERPCASHIYPETRSLIGSCAALCADF